MVLIHCMAGCSRSVTLCCAHLMQKYGMTPQQALVSGTKTGAALLGLEQLGTVETGKEGDLVAVEGDPLSDIHALEKVKAVVFQGKSVVPANRQ